VLGVNLLLYLLQVRVYVVEKTGWRIFLAFSRQCCGGLWKKWRDLTTSVLNLSQMCAKVVVDVKKE
jgi:hypothetical protein